jgi:hypothetical protein
MGWHWKMVIKTEQIQNARMTAPVTYIRRRKSVLGRMRRYDAMMEALVKVTAVAYRTWHTKRVGRRGQSLMMAQQPAGARGVFFPKKNKKIQMLTLIMFMDDGRTVARFRSHSCLPRPNLVPERERQRAVCWWLSRMLSNLPTKHAAERETVNNAATRMRTAGPSVFNF